MFWLDLFRRQFIVVIELFDHFVNIRLFIQLNLSLESAAEQFILNNVLPWIIDPVFFVIHSTFNASIQLPNQPTPASSSQSSTLQSQTVRLALSNASAKLHCIVLLRFCWLNQLELVGKLCGCTWPKGWSTSGIRWPLRCCWASSCSTSSGRPVSVSDNGYMYNLLSITIILWILFYLFEW